MKLCFSIVLLVLACLLPAMALAEVSRLASDTLHSRALEGNLLGDSGRPECPCVRPAKL